MSRSPLRVTLRPKAGDPVIETTPVLIARGLNRQAAALKTRVESVTSKLKADKRAIRSKAKEPRQKASSLERGLPAENGYLSVALHTSKGKTLAKASGTQNH